MLFVDETNIQKVSKKNKIYKRKNNNKKWQKNKHNLHQIHFTEKKERKKAAFLKNIPLIKEVRIIRNPIVVRDDEKGIRDANLLSQNVNQSQSSSNN